MNISKIIPFSIRIKTLYWVRKEKEIVSDLSRLFDRIDKDDYEEAYMMLRKLEDKWLEFSQTAPYWFQLEHIPQFAKANAMLAFLQSSL